MPRSLTFRRVAIALLLGFGSAITPLAQESVVEPAAGNAAARQEETPPPEPLGPSEIPRRAEEAAKNLRRIRSAPAPEDLVAGIEAGLRSTTGAVERLGAHLDAQRPESMTLRRLNVTLGEWTRHRVQVEAWLEELEESAQKIEGDLVELREMRELWERTRELAVEEEDYSETLLARVESSLQEIEDAEADLGGRRETLLELEGRILEELARIEEAVERISAAREEARGRLLAPDNVPLWNALTSEDQAPIVRQMTEAWNEKSRELSEFLADHSHLAIAHGLLFLALLLPTFHLHRRSRRWAEEDPSLEPSARVLAHPFSAALLISLLAARWIYPHLPTVVLEIILLAALPPLLQLLQAAVSSRTRRALYALGTLFILDRFRGLIGEQSPVGRLLLLALAAAALAGLLWLLRLHRPGSAETDAPWWRALKVAAPIAALLIATAIAANLAGAVSLAALLMNGTLGSAYFAFVLLAGFFVLDAAVDVALHTDLLRAVRSVRTNVHLVRPRTAILLKTAAVVWWVWGTLGVFNVLDPVLEAGSAVLGRRWAIGTVSVSIGNILAALATLWIAVLASRAIRAVMEEDLLSRISLPRGVPATISMMAWYGLLTVGVLLAAAAAGIQLTQFAFLLGALGVGIGFGLQNVVNNFVSGLILAFERPIQVGDVVETAGLHGSVQSIGIRSSIVRTFEGAEVIVPNGNLISAEVVNWTLSDRTRRIEIAVGVEYGTEPRQVVEILLAVAKEHPGVLSSPEPVALFTAFGESSLDFVLRVWTGEFVEWRRVSSEIAIAVNDALKRAGIQIPFPQRDLHLRSVDPAVQRVVRGAASDSAA